MCVLVSGLHLVRYLKIFFQKKKITFNNLLVTSEGAAIVWFPSSKTW